MITKLNSFGSIFAKNAWSQPEQSTHRANMRKTPLVNASQKRGNLCKTNTRTLLVGGLNPSEKYESQLGWLATQYFWENSKNGNQTTNQITIPQDLKRISPQLLWRFCAPGEAEVEVLHADSEGQFSCQTLRCWTTCFNHVCACVFHVYVYICIYIYIYRHIISI